MKYKIRQDKGNCEKVKKKHGYRRKIGNVEEKRDLKLFRMQSYFSGLYVKVKKKI